MWQSLMQMWFGVEGVFTASPARKPAQRRPRPGADGIDLEGRVVPAFVVSPPDANKVVKVVGSDAAETANVFVYSNVVSINGTTFAASAVRGLDVGGRGGDDTINVWYQGGTFNPTIKAYGERGNDKVEVWNSAGKDLSAWGGDGTLDRVALHNVAFLGRGRQVGFEKYWTDARPQDVAFAFKDRHVSELKFAGELPMLSWVANNVCCANFVSAVLQVTGQLSADAGPHQYRVADLAEKLRGLGWVQKAVSQARPGDVWIDRAGGRSHTELVLTNTNGAVTLIGANNVNADRTQRVSVDTTSARNVGSYVLSPNW